MKRLPIAFVLLLFAATSCMGGGGNTRTILVDYKHDQFSSFFGAYFPAHVSVHPGADLVFLQSWTGEPHTVTGGKLVDRVMRTGGPYITFFNAYDGLRATGVKLPDPENPPDIAWSDVLRVVDRSRDAAAKQQWLSAYNHLVALHEVLPSRKAAAHVRFPKVVEDISRATDKLFGGLDFGHVDQGFAQNTGQPCFLAKGPPPKDATKPCPRAEQRQPMFDGKQSFYDSGIIRYEGAQGNTFKVRLSPTIKPGSYYFFCLIHGPPMSTEVRVRPSSEKIPSQQDVSQQAEDEIRRMSKPMLARIRDARDGKVKIGGKTVEGPFAGLDVPEDASINEFLPKTIRTEVGKKVTWTIAGSDHSISFDVPKYFPIIQFRKNGTIQQNPTLFKPAGGSPKIPEPKEGKVLSVDGGTYNGKGFFSSSVFGSDRPYAQYTLRFSKPGTYKYACLIHPPMVGTVVVTK
jgi:plastocyanin